MLNFNKKTSHLLDALENIDVSSSAYISSIRLATVLKFLENKIKHTYLSQHMSVVTIGHG